MPLPPPPPGFTLDTPAAPPPPPGFQLDSAPALSAKQQETPSFLSHPIAATESYLSGLAKGIGETVTGLPSAIAGLPAEAERQAQAHAGETLAQRALDPAGMQQAANIALSFNPANIGASAASRELISPTPTVPTAVHGITPERAALAKEAIDKYGIPITAPQIGMAPIGKFAQSVTRHIPLSGVEEHELQVRQAWNRAVSRTFGANADAITPTVMKDAKTRLGGGINAIENSNSVTFTTPDITKLAALEMTAHSSMTKEEYGVISRLVDNVLRHVGPTGQLEGTTVGDLFRKGGALDTATGNSNRNIAHIASGIKVLLQDMLQRDLPLGVADDYRNLRFQYKNMKTVEPLANKSPTGDISPGLLNARVTQQFKDRAYDVSGHDLDKLGRIGQAFLKEPPSSGTAERGTVYYAGEKISELIAAILAGHFLSIPELAGTAAGALVVGRAAGSALRSPKLAERTISRVLTPTPKPPPPILPWAVPAGAGTLGLALGAKPNPPQAEPNQ